MRFVGVDVHRDFCEVALVDGGVLRLIGQIFTTPAELEVFAQSLAPEDVVAMEATANALSIARIIEPHVARVVLADPKAVKGHDRPARQDRQDRRAAVGQAFGGRVFGGGVDSG